MLGFLAATTLALGQQGAPPPGQFQPLHVRPPSNRFERNNYGLGVPGAMLDAYLNGQGLLQQAARARGLQARVLWVDGTANLNRVSTEEGIADLVENAAKAGFNTIVFDIKPISGQVLYPSKIAPKIRQWRGQTLPEDWDPVPPMIRHAKKHGLSILVALNALSEGHSLHNVQPPSPPQGPGYDWPHLQTFVYHPRFAVRDPSEDDQWVIVHPTLNEKPEEAPMAVFTQAARIQAREGQFAVTLDRRNRVVDGFEFGGVGRGVPTIPEGGVALVGSGNGAIFLRRFSPGDRIDFDTFPRFVPIMNLPEQQFPLMMNINQPEVQQRALAIVDEILDNYDFDGLLYDDRLRYGGINADFSPLSSQLFEEYVGKKLQWPDDVFKFTLNPNLQTGIQPGPYYDAWMTWRAQQMYNFVGRISHHVKQRGKLFGIYAGSWYGEYPKFGNNYASQDLEAGFWFLTPSYRQTGFAHHLDILMTGAYYPTATIYDAMGANRGIGSTIEAAGQLSNSVARDQCWTYAGILLQHWQGNPEGLERALLAAVASTQGVMVFDVSHNIEPMWPVFQRAFSQPARAPHDEPRLLDEMRRRRAALDAQGHTPRPTVISAGTSGTGH
jgi:hypothetical protein